MVLSIIVVALLKNLLRVIIITVHCIMLFFPINITKIWLVQLLSVYLQHRLIFIVELSVFIVMDKKQKQELLKGLNEYYANYRELLRESDIQENTVEINGLTHIQVDCSAEEWIKSVGGVNIEDIKWQN